MTSTWEISYSCAHHPMSDTLKYLAEERLKFHSALNMLAMPPAGGWQLIDKLWSIYT